MYIHDNKNYFLEVNHELKPVSDNAVWDGVIQKDSSWAYAEQGSFKMALRMMSKNHEEFYQNIVEKNFDNSDKIMKYLNQKNRIIEKQTLLFNHPEFLRS